jgi:hypothetical protein
MQNTSMTYPQTWPGTAIIKTQHNAFNWRGQPSEVFAANTMLFKAGTHSANGMKAKAKTEPRLSPQQKVAAELKRQRHSGQYSKAVAAK